MVKQDKFNKKNGSFSVGEFVYCLRMSALANVCHAFSYLYLVSVKCLIFNVF
jgi:hypothetical protein